MVLRGSNIAPPSLHESQGSLAEARANLLRAQQELLRVQHQSLLDIQNIDPETSSLTKSQLLNLVSDLQTQLADKQRQEQAAEEQALRARQALANTLKQLAVGGAAGAIARTTVAPMDRVKILMQTSHLTGQEAQHRSVLQSFQSIIRAEGVARLWRGNFTNCIRVIPHTATQFVAYDKYKNLLVGDQGEMSIPKRLLSGALSGMTAATVTHPMDVVRIRLQTQPELRGIADSVRSIYREGGVRTFYKGYTPAMLSLSPFIAINFATMDTLKAFFFGAEDRHLTKKQLQQRNPLATLGLGAISGIFAQTVCYPLDTVRRRMQLAGRNYTSTGNAFATIFRTEGMRGFYKGMTANALKVVPNNAVRFAAFDFLKTFIMKDLADAGDVGGGGGG